MRNSKRKTYKRVLLITIVVLVFISIVLKISIWDNNSNKWLIEYFFNKPDESKKLTIAPPINGTTINDASWLNSTVVSSVYEPTSVQEVKNFISLAKAYGKKISISGIRHSMGGQAFLKDAVQLDMTKFDNIQYNSDRTVTVGPGATWKQIQNVIGQFGRSVEVMQDSNIFTIGGSVSVNVHGKDPRYKSLISTINYLKIITSDGKEVICSRVENPELFKAVVGGYGLFGVITEVNLTTTDNSTYKFNLQKVSTSNLLNTLESLSQDKNVQLIEAHLSINQDNFLSDSLIYTYAFNSSKNYLKSDISGENSTWLRKLALEISKSSDFGKLFRWDLEKYASPLVEPNLTNRNTAMSAPVRFLEQTNPNTTEILQEYFVPNDKFYDFLTSFGSLVKKHQMNLLNVTVRKVPRDTESLLSYATDDMYAFVVYFSVDRSDQGITKTTDFTKEIVNNLISFKGTYYLPYGAYYEYEQLLAMYLTTNEFFKTKDKYDPNQLFLNNWYVQIRNQ